MAEAQSVDSAAGADGRTDDVVTDNPTDSQTNGVEHENAQPRFCLSRREAQVLHLAAEGWEYQEIGDRLGITRATVRNHMVSVRRKLGARNSLHALAIALRRKLISLDEEVEDVSTID